jgi:SPP1 gp7 family putative phage head morphogenesis protein
MTLPRIGKAVAGWIRSVSASGKPPSFASLQETKYPDVDTELVRQTELLLSGSLLLGMDHAQQGMRLADPGTEYHPLPFEEAIQFLKSRGRLTTALEKGEGFEQAWADVKAIADADGSTIKPGYWETVYRTNAQTAYNAGRRMQFDRVPPKAIALMVLEDDRTSDICKPLAGLVLPYNHPFWENHWPPFHFNCRTTVRGIYEEEMAQVPVQNVPMRQLRKNFKSQEGFGQNPLSGSFYEITDSMAKRALHYGIMKDLKDFADQAGFKSVRLYNPDSMEGFSLFEEYKNGGKLYIHEYFGKKKPPELDIARLISSQGKTVKILPRSDFSKSPDLWIDKEIWEVKTVRGTYNSIDQALRSKQSENIILLVSNVKQDTLQRAIEQRAQRASLKHIIAIDKLGTILFDWKKT